MNSSEHTVEVSEGSPQSPTRLSWSVTTVITAAPFLLLIVSRFFPGGIERFYSNGVFPYIGRAVGYITGLLPFSIAELAIVCLIALFPVGSVWYLRNVRRKKVGFKDLLSTLARRGLLTFGILGLVFQVVWGLNYARLPLADTLNFDESPPNQVELAAIAKEIVGHINTSYHDLHTGSAASLSNGRDESSLRNSIEQSYAANRMLAWPAAQVGYSRPKPVLFHNLLARFGVAGVYSPFTAEPNYIDTLPEFDLPFTMAHEMAHARGYARENEADFVAFLICTTSSDARLRYSGYLSGLRVLSQLSSVDPAAYREIAKTLDDGPKRDLKTRFEFWAVFRGTASYVGNRVNDFYLKANGIRSGVKNYDEVSALIIGYVRTLKRANQGEENLALSPSGAHQSAF